VLSNKTCRTCLRDAVTARKVLGCGLQEEPCVAAVDGLAVRGAGAGAGDARDVGGADGGFKGGHYFVSLAGPEPRILRGVPWGRAGPA